ncbi:hypothetical protein ACFLSA_03575 [Bacteroidota bacterium]
MTETPIIRRAAMHGKDTTHGVSTIHIVVANSATKIPINLVRYGCGTCIKNDDSRRAAMHGKAAMHGGSTIRIVVANSATKIPN